jgi:hypothetical protein
MAPVSTFVLASAVVCSSPAVALGQETGSDVQVVTGAEVVSSASFALVAGPAAAAAAAATPQAFAIAVQAAITSVLVASGGESQARTQLGDFRTSILMKAGVLAFDGARAAQAAQAPPTSPTSRIELEDPNERKPKPNR